MFRFETMRSLFEATPEGPGSYGSQKANPDRCGGPNWAVIGPIVMPLLRRRANATSQRLKRVLEAGRG
jgi:hypothetical protein